MDDNIRNPQEDISFIKMILAKTADGMKSLAPYFIAFGIIWLCHALLITGARIITPVLALRGMDPATFGVFMSSLSRVNLGQEAAFYSLLGVGFVVCCRKESGKNVDSLTMKLIYMWGVCIFLFIFLSVVLRFASVAAARYQTSSAGEASLITYGTYYVGNILYFLFPVLPLIVTSLFLENRRMFIVSLVLTLLSSALYVINLVFTRADTMQMTEVILRYGLAGAVELMPAVMLIVFGKHLKRE